ncbi:MAG: bifunctional diaminohydroxyphosphoribosylaminopyrimidine deaminase/5-amino-6-(5-phosphoribosylamino)uracil reductase RibD [Acutalibacteraceae bacterium]
MAEQDEFYMARALELAKNGMGFVNPNPMVGAIVVKNGKIIGEGWHECYGQLHAERNALANCTESPEGASIYVTLEPCCHYGKTPPCTEAIIENKLSRVIIGSDDCNPLVKGKSKNILKEHGIEVTDHVLKEECDRLNEHFFWFIAQKRPYVIMKYAMTMDGKIATHTGLSQWITSEPARQRVHADRHRYMAIMVGVGTVLADNPLLTCRKDGGKNPIRIICDTHLKTPLDSRIVQTAAEVRTIIATACMDTERQKPYINKQCEIMLVPTKDGHIDLNVLMDKLGAEKIDSVILEGGAALNEAALRSGIVNRVQTYIAPKIFGGVMAKTPVGGVGVDSPAQAYPLKTRSIEKIGEDFLIESDVIPNVHGDC